MPRRGEHVSPDADYSYMTDAHRVRTALLKYRGAWADLAEAAQIEDRTLRRIRNAHHAYVALSGAERILDALGEDLSDLPIYKKGYHGTVITRGGLPVVKRFICGCPIVENEELIATDEGGYIVCSLHLARPYGWKSRLEHARTRGTPAPDLAPSLNPDLRDTRDPSDMEDDVRVALIEIRGKCEESLEQGETGMLPVTVQGDRYTLWCADWYGHHGDHHAVDRNDNIIVWPNLGICLK